MVEDVERTPVRPKRRRRKALYFTSKKERFRLIVGKKNANKEAKRKVLNTVEETVKALKFDAMEDDEGAKSKEHVDDCIGIGIENEFKKDKKSKAIQRSHNLIVHTL